MIRQNLPASVKLPSPTTHHLNINDVVLVALTPHGNRIAEDDNAYELKTVNDLGQTKWQLWRLLEVFGPHTYHGGKQIFVDNRLVWTSTREEKL